MDKILVTLLLIIIGLSTAVGLKSWMSDAQTTLVNDANSSINRLIDENN